MKLEKIFSKTKSLKCIECDDFERKTVLDEVKDRLINIHKIPSVLDSEKNYTGFEIDSKHKKRFLILVDDSKYKDPVAVVKIHLKYAFFSSSDILNILTIICKLPLLSSFETVGNVVHLNLTEEHLPYRYIIGKVLYDKTGYLVINKLGNIHSVFRYYNFEVLAGPNVDYEDFKKYRINNLESNSVVRVENIFDYKVNQNITITEVDINMKLLNDTLQTFYDEKMNYRIDIDILETVHIENGIKFFIDLKRVYWCSRLQNERQELIKSFKNGEVVCDVFCGVGPITIPLLKKGCLIYCNDLNARAIECLKKNVKLNHIDEKLIHVYNKDAADFLEVVKDKKFDHFILNLPEYSLDYIERITDFDGSFLIHCYFFCSVNEDVYEYVSNKTCRKIERGSIRYVRKVSPSKSFYKLEYKKC